MIQDKNVRVMYKILLITTEGCEGCAIMKNNIQAAISKEKKDIAFEVKDRKDINKKFLNINRIKDFPTTILFEYDRLKFKYSGTMPSIVVTRWIDIHFK